MKNFKKILTILFVSSCFGTANAQLMVDENGRAAIGYEKTSNLNSDLSINGDGNNYTNVHIVADKPTGLYINHYPVTRYLNNYGLYNINYSVPDYTNIGIYTNIAGGSTANTKNVGMYANVYGTNTGGYNYAIYGYLNSTGNGTGVFGSTTRYLGSAFPEITGNYAGFFYGEVCITSALTVGYVNQLSDYRLKENIRPLTDADGCLDKVMDMNVVEYNMKQREFETNVTEQDKAEAKAREAELTARGVSAQEMEKLKKKDEGRALWYEENSPIIKNKHYGLIAQELQEIYPNLVDEGQDGYLAINYTEIIPILIRSIQELKAEVNTLRGNNNPMQKTQARTTDVTGIEAVVTTLYQNTPNPFMENTLIRCDVADEVVKADLYIYNMNGEQITEYTITERGKTSITINGGSLNAGMYLYALIADGQVIDTKRMILTK